MESMEKGSHTAWEWDGLAFPLDLSCKPVEAVSYG